MVGLLGGRLLLHHLEYRIPSSHLYRSPDIPHLQIFGYFVDILVQPNRTQDQPPLVVRPLLANRIVPSQLHRVGTPHQLLFQAVGLLLKGHQNLGRDNVLKALKLLGILIVKGARLCIGDRRQPLLNLSLSQRAHQHIAALIVHRREDHRMFVQSLATGLFQQHSIGDSRIL